MEKPLPAPGQKKQKAGALPPRRLPAATVVSDSSGNVTLTVAGSAAASGDLVGEIICALFLLCGTAAALGGIYATVVFALCSL